MESSLFRQESAPWSSHFSCQGLQISFLLLLRYFFWEASHAPLIGGTVWRWIFILETVRAQFCENSRVPLVARQPPTRLRIREWHLFAPKRV